MTTERIVVDFRKVNKPDNKKFFNLLDPVKMGNFLQAAKSVETDKELQELLKDLLK